MSYQVIWAGRVAVLILPIANRKRTFDEPIVEEFGSSNAPEISPAVIDQQEDFGKDFEPDAFSSVSAAQNSNAEHRQRNTIMKTLQKTLVAGILGLAAWGSAAQACDYRRPVNTPINPPAAPPTNGPQIPDPPRPGLVGLNRNDQIINDLPIEAKRAIKAAAAKSRPTTTVRTTGTNRINSNIR